MQTKKHLLAVFAVAALCGGVARGATYSWNSGANGNWSTASLWSPNDGTYPGSDGTTGSGDVAWFSGSTGTCAVDGDYTISSIRAAGAGTTYILQNSGTHAIALTTTGTGIAYSAANTGGFVYATSGQLTLTATNAASAFLNFGGGALFGGNTANGTVILSGNVISGQGSSWPTLYGPNAKYTLNGNLIMSSSSPGYPCGYITNGSFVLNGIPFFGTSNAKFNEVAVPLRINGGSCSWQGTQSISAGTSATIQILAGTLNTSSLTLTNSGNLLIWQQAGSTWTKGSMAITNATSAAQCVGINCTIPFTGPLIPSGSNVLTTAPQYGYASSLISGSASAGGAGQPMIGSPFIHAISVFPLPLLAMGTMEAIGANVAIITVSGLLSMALWTFAPRYWRRLRQRWKRQPKPAQSDILASVIAETEQRKVFLHQQLYKE
jgi:hypothetical protein